MPGVSVGRKLQIGTCGEGSADQHRKWQYQVQQDKPTEASQCRVCQQFRGAAHVVRAVRWPRSMTSRYPPTRNSVVSSRTTASAAPKFTSKITLYCWKISIDMTMVLPPLMMLGVT